MNVKQLTLTLNNWDQKLKTIDFDVNLFLLFVSPEFNYTKQVLSNISKSFPNATVIGCSTAGEISDVVVNDKSISLTVIQFEKTEIKKVTYLLDNIECSNKAGVEIANALNKKDLQHVLVLSDGLNVNGADFVNSLRSNLPKVGITGGLAADGTSFNKTFVINDNEIVDKTIVAIGFYGDSLKVGYSSKGGWDSFGIERLVTKSKKNVLYELDGKPALKLYKSFLGEQANNLPSSGLLFPLSLRINENTTPVVRTILGVNENEQSLTFAGNIPENSYVRLMKANIDRLISGAEDSAISANKAMQTTSELAILISCVGRRLVLKQLVEEEIEVVREVIGESPIITGFYSYGEIAPFDAFKPCELHNQTMTITTFSEC